MGLFLFSSFGVEDAWQCTKVQKALFGARVIIDRTKGFYEEKIDRGGEVNWY